MESALARTNPATARGHTQASVPPHTMTSADPAWMNLNPSPTAWDPVAHAVDTELLGPRKPCAMLMCPGARLGRILGR